MSEEEESYGVPYTVEEMNSKLEMLKNDYDVKTYRSALRGEQKVREAERILAVLKQIEEVEKQKEAQSTQPTSTPPPQEEPKQVEVPPASKPRLPI